MSTSKNRFNRILIKIVIISLFVIALCGICISHIINKEYITGVGELLYSVCYLLVYTSIFIFLTSIVALIVNQFRKPKDV